MRKLYEKKEILFAVLWIVAYCVILGTIRGNFGDESIYMLLALLVFTAGIIAFVKANHLEGKYGKYYPQMLKFLENNLPCDKDVFYIHTAGDPRENHADSAKKIAEEKNCRCLGVFYCKGFDTFGPFKLVGGINKNRPNTEDMEQAVQFYRGLNK